ncbi:MAG: hypothetical protein B6U69_02195 [Thermofilum sp. ex4484_15]|nr:MAG: hypothetical protein B6U69_02195 [Thermofilum sp. ex4484_15]
MPSFDSVRIKRQGSALFVDLHLVVDPAMSIYKAHEMARELEKKIKEKNPSIRDVIIHVGPG